ncbi:MAG TPA: DNA polymerase III subunit beta [Polyangiaceae bacterium]
MIDLTAPKPALVAALSRAAAVADKRSTHPTLACVHLTADAGKLTIVAADLYCLSVRTTIEADVGHPGVAAIPAKELHDRVRAMPDGPVRLAMSGGKVNLTSKGSTRRYAQRALLADDFPPVAWPEPGLPELRVPSAAMAALIGRVEHAISTDESRAFLNGMLISRTPGRLRVVAIDSHQLALADAKLDGDGASTFLLPRRAVVELRKLCEGDEGDVAIVLSGSSAYFTVGGVSMGARLFDATFPPYENVVPGARPCVVRAPRAPLSEAIKAVMLASDPKHGDVTLAMSTSAIVVTAKSADAGDASEEVPAELTGKPVAINASASYLLNALASLEGDEAAIDVGAPEDPVTFREPDFLGLVMPMRAR